MASVLTTLTSPATSPPKLAYIMSRFPKLTETFILYEILALEELGVPVEIFPLLRERQPVTHPEADRLVRRAHFLPFVSWSILRAQGHFIRRRPLAYFSLWAEVVRETCGSLNFLVGAIGIFMKAVRFAYEVESRQVRHIHAHFVNHPAVAALIIHRLTGVPFSFTAHGSDLHVDRRMLKKKVEAAAFAVTISAYNKELMIQECGNRVREKIHVIHCGVDVDIFSRRCRPRGEQPFQILCVASFEAVKGHKHLLEACRLLRARGVDFVCHLVGDGPLRLQVKGQIEAANLAGSVVMHGMLSRPEVAKMYRAADVVVLASVFTERGDREGIPIVLMEAMASGVPVVASAISGIPELVDAGRTGLLVPPGDPSALADALQTVKEADAERRYLMGAAGREKVQAKFNLKTNAVALRDLLLGEKEPNPEASLQAEAAREVASSLG